MKVGQSVADFRLDDDNGAERSLYDFLEKGPVVLFFFPMAMTPGCTAECRHFRDLGTEFVRFGAQRIGISRDSVDKQHKFAEANSFDFALLSDPDGAVSQSFGVRRAIGFLPNRRWTFVIGQDRRIITVIKSETNMDRHAELAIKALADLNS